METVDFGRITLAVAVGEMESTPTGFSRICESVAYKVIYDDTEYIMVPAGVELYFATIEV